jgi:hypothetical protein
MLSEAARRKLRAATEKKSKVSPIDVAAELIAQSRQRHPRRTTKMTPSAKGDSASTRVASAKVEPGQRPTRPAQTIDPRRTQFWLGDLPPGHPLYSRKRGK